jgi:DNA-repair protein complementing XP-A cells
MMLFLRLQVEAFAFSDKKWGSPEALDAEFARREAEKKEKKGKKFEKKLRELRRGTKVNVWHKRIESEHVHEFGSSMRNSDGNEVQRCVQCDFEIEVETF